MLDRDLLMLASAASMGPVPSFDVTGAVEICCLMLDLDLLIFAAPIAGGSPTVGGASSTLEEGLF